MFDERDEIRRFNGGRSIRKIGLIIAGLSIPALGIIAYVVYTQFRIDVPAKHFAVLTRKTGEDVDNDQEVAPDEQHKGLQLDVLSEGRYFKNPYDDLGNDLLGDRAVARLVVTYIVVRDVGLGCGIVAIWCYSSFNSGFSFGSEARHGR